jgi:hypothetical protein
MGRNPVEGMASNIRVKKCIRRANLDAFWSCVPGTVRGTLDKAKRGISIAKALGFRHLLFGPRGPFPIEDSMQMGCHAATLPRERPIC